MGHETELQGIINIRSAYYENCMRDLSFATDANKNVFQMYWTWCTVQVEYNLYNLIIITCENSEIQNCDCVKSLP